MVVNPAKIATTTPTSERAISAHTLISIVATHIPMLLLSIFLLQFFDCLVELFDLDLKNLNSFIDCLFLLQVKIH